MDFGPVGLTLARTAYRLSSIPQGQHMDIISQAKDDGSLVILQKSEMGFHLNIFSPDPFPSDGMSSTTHALNSLREAGRSTSRDYIYVSLLGRESPRAIPNTGASLRAFVLDISLGPLGATTNIADTEGMALSVWPALEYQQMFGDAWRMFRDYFYDVDMHQVDWPAVYSRYKSLVSRCAKREDLDDVLGENVSAASSSGSFSLSTNTFQPHWRLS